MGGKTTTISNSETKAEALRLQSSSYGATVAVIHGQTRIAGNLLDYGNFKAIAHTDTQESGGKGGGGVRTESTTYTYSATVLMGLCEGPIQDVSAVWAGKTKYPNHHGPGGTEDILIYGNIGQATWSGLSSMASSDHSIGYSGMAMFGVLDYELGGSADMPNHNFEVIARGAYQVHSTLADADASLIIQDWIQHPRYGRGLTSVTLGGIADLSSWSKASGLMFSPALTEQAPAADRINQMCELVNAAVVPADGKLNFVVLATEPVSRTLTAAGGATTTFSYTPDVTPLFELSAEQIMPEPGQPRIKVIRKTPADIYNTVKVEFRNRSNDYAVDVAVVEDRANVDLFGPLLAPTVKADWICDHQIAQTYGRMKLQRYLTQLREYEFALPWNYSDLLPTNLLLINDEDQGVSSALVRVKQITETEGGWTVRAVDCPSTQSAAPVYALPAQDGYKHRYTADPGATVIKAVFEAPFDLTTSGLEVWAAVVGSTSDWGGAHIWVSLDGVNYRQVSTVFGGSRAGLLSGSIGSGSFTVNSVTGKVLSGGAGDATQKATLCYVGGTTPEYLSYTTATLTSTGTYTLSGLVRAQYGTSDASAHAANDVWVRCDEALAKSGPLDLTLIGQQIYIKCQSFNVFGLKTQDLATVTATTYTITGKFARPTEDPYNLIKEGFFGALALGQKPETWSEGVVETITGQGFSRALKFTTDNVTESLSRIQVANGDVFWFGGWGIADYSAGGDFGVGIEFFDAAGASLGFVKAATYPSSQVTVGSNGRSLVGPAPWVYRSGTVAAPSGAVYGVPKLKLESSPSVAYSNRVADLVLRRQASTLDVQSGAATGTYNSINTPAISITQPEYGTGDSDRQTLLTLSVTTPVQCGVVLTVFADAFAQNAASGTSATLGGGVTLGVYSSGFAGAAASSRQGINVGPGANAAKSGTISLSDIMQLKPGTWDLQLRASKFTSDMTGQVSNIRYRVEVIKL